MPDLSGFADGAMQPAGVHEQDRLWNTETLPPGFRLWAAAPSACSEKARPAPAGLARLPLPRGLSVLLVSGDSTVLSDLTARVTLARGRAVPQARTHALPPLSRIGLAIIDLDGEGDPDDAVGLCLRLRRARFDLPIIALDSAVQIQAGATALAMGVCDALAPPADRTTTDAAEALAAAVARALEPAGR